MSSFVPKLAFIQEAALAYPLGRELMSRLQAEDVEVSVYEKRIPISTKKTFRERFLLSKRTMVVLIWKRREFQTCRPSAHYQLPLVSGCPGSCQCCYLAVRPATTERRADTRQIRGWSDSGERPAEGSAPMTSSPSLGGKGGASRSVSHVPVSIRREVPAWSRFRPSLTGRYVKRPEKGSHWDRRAD